MTGMLVDLDNIQLLTNKVSSMCVVGALAREKDRSHSEAESVKKKDY